MSSSIPSPISQLWTQSSESVSLSPIFGHCRPPSQARHLEAGVLPEMFALALMLLSNSDYVRACAELVGRRVVLFNGVEASSSGGSVRKERRLTGRPVMGLITDFNSTTGTLRISQRSGF